MTSSRQRRMLEGKGTARGRTRKRRGIMQLSLTAMVSAQRPLWGKWLFVLNRQSPKTRFETCNGADDSLKIATGA